MSKNILLFCQILLTAGCFTVNRDVIETATDIIEEDMFLQDQEHDTTLADVTTMIPRILHQPRSLFGQVTPVRIKQSLESLSREKGADGVGKVVKFSLFHGKEKNKKIDVAKVSEAFANTVSRGFLRNMLHSSHKEANQDDDESDILVTTPGTAVLEHEPRELITNNQKIDNDYEGGDNDSGAYGDNMEFFNIDNGLVIDEINEENDVDDSLTMSTLQYFQQTRDNNAEEDEDQEYLLYLGDSDILSDNDNAVDEDIYDEVQVADVQDHSVQDPVLKQPSSFQSYYTSNRDSYKIPVADFDSFESETFSDAPRRIPQQFSRLIKHPWIQPW